MDSVSRPEFHDIFDRVSRIVDLQGAFTATEIDNRIRLTIRQFMARAQSPKQLEELRKHLRRELGRRMKHLERQIMYLKAGINRQLRLQKLYHAEQFKKLLDHDFSDRVIWEANRSPRGVISQTLLHGTEGADLRMMAQRAARERIFGTTEDAKRRRREWYRKATGA